MCCLLCIQLFKAALANLNYPTWIYLLVSTHIHWTEAFVCSVQPRRQTCMCQPRLCLCPHSPPHALGKIRYLRLMLYLFYTNQFIHSQISIEKSCDINANEVIDCCLDVKLSLLWQKSTENTKSNLFMENHMAGIYFIN